MRRVTARRVVAETWLRPAACAEPLAPAPGPSGGSGGNGNHGSCGRWSAVLGSAASRGVKVVEDAADDATLGKEGDHPHHASAAGAAQRIGLVNPAKELSPSAAKGGQRGRRGGMIWRRQSEETALGLHVHVPRNGDVSKGKAFTWRRLGRGGSPVAVGFPEPGSPEPPRSEPSTRGAFMKKGRLLEPRSPSGQEFPATGRD
jgi:hypothetical protein